MPPGKHHTWAQAASKGLTSSSSGTTIPESTIPENEPESCATPFPKVTKMAETVNESQIAAAFSEGWGQRGINQDTAWDVPSSPQCSPKEGSTWSGSTSNGTEIWESNARLHKGPNMSSSGQIREPWGHAPTTHIGGTWGEEEDTTNVWTGVPQASSAPWGNDSSAVWASNPPEGKSWGNQSSNLNSTTWGNDSAPLQLALAHLPLGNDPKNISEDNVPDTGTGVFADPSHKRGFGNWSPITGGNKKQMPPSGWEETAPAPPVTCQSGPNFDDGTAVWGNPVHQGKVSRWKEMPPTKQITNCMIQSSNMCSTGNPCTGPGMIRLPPSATNMNKNDSTWMKNSSLNHGLSWTEMPNYRDTSGREIWDGIHNQLQDKNVPGTPTTPNSAFGNWGDPNNPAGNYWASKAKNASAGWADGQVDTSSWGGPMKQGGKPLSKDLIWASKQFRLLSEMNFKKDDIENALRRSNMNLEEALLELHALSSKSGSMDMDGMVNLNLNQSRIPHGNDDMNFSEQSIDNTVIPGNMYGANNFPGMTTMFSSGFNIAQNVKNQQPTVGNNIAPNVLGTAAVNNQGPNFNLNNGMNNMSPAMVRKILQQSRAFNTGNLPQNTVNNQPVHMNPLNFASSAEVRNVVQQIQMAVHAGYLNAQILIQPLAPQTLLLLYQLLHQIKILRQFQQQQHFIQSSKNCSSPPLQLSVQITQTKQHIVNLQNQIAAQQAIFLKQQNLQMSLQHPSLQNPQPSAFDIVKSNIDAINGLHMDFRDLSVKEPAQTSAQSHSRLHQWKLPTFDRDDNPLSNENNGCNRESNNSNCPPSEFSRAPGSVSKSSSANSLSSTTAPHSTSNLQPLNESTWGGDMTHAQDSWGTEPNDSSSCNNSGNGDSNFPSGDTGSDGAPNKLSNSASDKESPATTIPSTSSSSQSSYNLNDLVSEFEPGKPWKGTSRIKNFEDDPHVTPGSITKSPLSLNSIKDSELFTWNVKPNASSQNSSASLTTTWSFSPPLAPSAMQNNVSGKQSGSKSWANRSSDSSVGWKGPQPITKTRGPPPGLAGQGKNLSPNWMQNENNSQNWSSNTGWEKQSGSNFLVLRNLTPQIDGSTLKTLCLQHGPLQLFHLVLNHGIALIKYSSREESEKARCALNNCVFSNTTILVDIPTEAEVKQYLQLTGAPNIPWSQGGNTTSDASFGTSGAYPLSSSSSVGGTNSSGGSGKMNPANWNTAANINLPGSHLWSFPGSGNGVWGVQPSPTDQDQGIPSSLNSFLPGDLLGGGESI